MRKFYSFLFTAFMLFALAAKSQNRSSNPSLRCGTDDYMAQMIKEDPSYLDRINQMNEDARQAALNTSGQKSSMIQVTIPVVFHVVWYSSAQNISNARIMAQLDVLNKDYAKLNADTGSVPAVFKPVAANTDVQFCLAQRDVNGNPTTGIIRTQTTVTSWSGSNNGIKYTAQGGQDAWDRTKYLNVWVCNLGSGLLGYATFPGGSAALDGVVVLFSSVGGPTSPGTANPYHLGRTLTHEVGHWLNLYHTFEGGCQGTNNNNCLTGGDRVCDTPPTSTSNFSCPGTQNTCTETSPFPSPYTMDMNDQTMNYMDYVDDACMYMFTLGQKARMQTIFNLGGSRYSLLSSNGCLAVGVNEIENLSAFAVYPNPVSGSNVNVQLHFNQAEKFDLTVINSIGQVVYTMNENHSVGGQYTLPLADKAKGVYFIRVSTEKGTTSQKISLL